MEKKALLAIVLSVAVLLLYQFLYIKPLTEKQRLEAQQAAQNAPQTKKETKTTAADDKAAATSPVQAAAVNTPALANEKPDAHVAVKQIIVDTLHYTAVVGSLGGVIESFKLKEYKNDAKKDIDLIDKTAKFGAFVIGATTDFELSQAAFTTDSKNLTLSGTDTGQVVLDYESNGKKVKRTYTFYADSFKVGLKDETIGISPYYITIGSGFSRDGGDGYGAHFGPVILNVMDRVEFNEDKKMDDIKKYADGVKWIAEENKYFCASLVPLSPMVETTVWQIPATPSVKQKSMAAFKSTSAVNEFLIYAGPKKYDLLKALNVTLEPMVDFGYFSIIARPLFWFLLFLNKYFGNFGVAIIVLTLIVRIPFIPLINKGQSSMKKLQKIQPLMTEIREKYKKDPQKMQREMMALYKVHKVNPMGGCLPIVIQIPVFFALYKALLVSVELRGAPFFFWVTDLSAKDPIYVLPIIMGATMFIQQKMTPTTMDPTQAKIMMIMPIVFTFMFLSFPSGLVLYWLVSNVLSIVQQMYVNRKTAAA
ncbi:membrane protein insertase YidC [Candidatus Magnetomonas plexicatena]|uniref:membrane protein insertase YidC n=1 Tax=Candidatus Magnetomonas plexicatena TaxID=2552947 RepID=UPI00110016BE|nr:membrane protein insertase YidC [Nitrospirales bacterium LBB_01]